MVNEKRQKEKLCQLDMQRQVNETQKVGKTFEKQQEQEKLISEKLINFTEDRNKRVHNKSQHLQNLKTKVQFNS